MAADGQAMITGEDEDGVIVLAAGLESVQDSANLLIQKSDTGIIIGQMAANEFRRARPGGELFVADCHLAVVEWVPRQEIQRKRRGRAFVEIMVSSGRDPRIVWTVEGDVTKERPLTRLAAEKSDGAVGEYFDSMLAGEAFVSQCASSNILDRQFVRVAHAAKEDGLPFLE